MPGPDICELQAPVQAVPPADAGGAGAALAVNFTPFVKNMISEPKPNIKTHVGHINVLSQFVLDITPI